MNSKASDGGEDSGIQPVNGKIENKCGTKLEPVLRFWGSYCYADVSEWTEDEISEFSESVEATPGSVRRQQSGPRVHRANGGYSDDE